MPTEEERRRLRAVSDASIGGINYDFDQIARENRIRFGRSWATLSDQIKYFDVARMPDIDGATMPLMGHLIFTRPSLNVACEVGSGNNSNEYGADNYVAMCNNSVTAAWARDIYGKQMLHMLSAYNDNYYMPIFYNKAMSYSVADMNINTIDKGHTFFGHYIKYGATTQEYRTAGSVTIEFRNDVYQSVMKAIALWISYISIISFDDCIKPAFSSTRNGILDYCGSIYYLVTKMNMTDLVYWEKLTGVFPKNVPLSMFSYSDAPIVEDKFSVDFEYAIRSDPCDPNVLFDLNVLSGRTVSRAERFAASGAALDMQGPHFTGDIPYTRNNLALPRDYEGPFGLGNVFARSPVVQNRMNDDGTISYLLQFRRDY